MDATNTGSAGWSLCSGTATRHDLLDHLKGKTGRSTAYHILRRRVKQMVCKAAGIDYGDGSQGDDIEEAWVAGAMQER